MELQNGFDFLKEIPKDNLLLRDRYIEPPFSILDTRQGTWQNRKRAWLAVGIKSEIGRDAVTYNIGDKETWQAEIDSRNAEYVHKDKGYSFAQKHNAGLDEKTQRALGVYASGMGSVVDRNTGGQVGTSIFDPVLTELMYNWFCPDNGEILDPFAGGSVRGIIANMLGYHYTGIELRKEQVDSNYEQSASIIPDNQPKWYIGDSNKVLDTIDKQFDFILSCPPYVDLEVYSDLPDDLSNMPYYQFMVAYRSIIKKSLGLLKTGCLACFVVGEVRDKNGYYYGFVSDTIKAFTDNGAKLYNDAVLLNAVGTAPIRAANQFPKGKKLVKIHQNVLVFKKI